MLKILRQVLKEIKELEPKNIIDYIFKGSGIKGRESSGQ